MYQYILVLLCIIISFYFIKRRNKNKIPAGYKKVPIVKGGLPVIGNGLDFSKDIIGFVRQCYRKYGKIFKVRIYSRDFVIVCDHDLKSEFFKISENEMSLYHVLDSLYFSNGFSDDSSALPQIIDIVKSTISVKFNEFAPKIMEEARRMIKRLEKKTDKKINLSEELIKFIAFTSAKCFIGYELTEEFFEIFIKFTNLLNRMVVLTYFCPKFVLNKTLNQLLKNYRHKLTKMLEPEIEKYRKDLKKNDSLVIRKSVDYITEKGDKLTNSEVGDVLVTLLYVGSENTALGLNACIVDLTSNPKYWDKVKEECFKFLECGDIKGLLSCQILDSCVMESARMNTHIFPLTRKPLKKKTLGDYYVGNVDCVVLCEPMMMVHEASLFKNSLSYDPDRYERGEKKNMYNVMTWGAGKHLCPGKMFALYEIKIAIAFLTTTFKKILLEECALGELNYFSPSAFAERKFEVVLHKLSDKQNMNIINYNNKGWLIKNFIKKEEQCKLYHYTTKLLLKDQKDKIKNVNDNRSCPLAFWNLVYTETSNCAKPDKWFELANIVLKILNNAKDEIKYDGPKEAEFDSVYSQLYGINSKMNIHKDEYVDFGISVSLGASCEFKFGDDNIVLSSGDIFVSDFSKVDHGILKILPNTQPIWFNSNYKYKGESIETFGKTRCSVQIRNIGHCKNKPKMNIEDFYKMLEENS